MTYPIPAFYDAALAEQSTPAFLSAASSSLLTGSLGPMVIAGAAGMDSEDIEASDVTLFTILLDKSSSIAFGGLENAVWQGQQELLDSLLASREGDSVLLAQWTS
ncbi:MAG: hypothetical protein GY822_23015 [Deltaproteobacteria bacterium]|nr:hypothetical protein [Deltaproteobacteria bacterium]